MANAPEFEITPAMIAAGRRHLWAYTSDRRVDHETALRAIFSAMWKARAASDYEVAIAQTISEIWEKVAALESIILKPDSSLN